MAMMNIAAPTAAIFILMVTIVAAL